MRNRLFTGHEDVSEKVHGELQRERRVALSGLGGIGKTQTAIEYAHRYRSDYNAVFSIRTDTETAFTAGMIEIAGVLALPGRDAKDETVAAVKRWLLGHDRWLLIADNADELALVKNVLPFDAQGRILLTTRAAAGTSGVAEAVKLKKMEPEEGARFLLRKAGLLRRDSGHQSAPDDQQAAGRELNIKLDGLPLALDQAGLAVLYRRQDCNREAEPLLERARAIVEEELEPGHPDVAWKLEYLAELYRDQDQYAKAETLYQRARTIFEKAIGRSHPVLARNLQVTQSVGEL